MIHHTAAPDDTADPRALLDQIGPLNNARALVLGDSAYAMLPGLAERGCRSAAQMSASIEPMPAQADLVLLPLVRSATAASAMIALARRALVPGGRIVLRLIDRRFGRLTVVAGLLLRRQGFLAAGLRAVPPEILLTAWLLPSRDVPVGIRAIAPHPVVQMTHAFR